MSEQSRIGDERIKVCIENAENDEANALQDGAEYEHLANISRDTAAALRELVLMRAESVQHSETIRALRADLDTSETARKQATAHAVQLQSELAALRRPVSGSDAENSLNGLAKYFALEVAEPGKQPFKTIIEIYPKSAAEKELARLNARLDAAQRELAAARGEISYLKESWGDLLDSIGLPPDSTIERVAAEFARLSSPPEERREIVESQELRRQTGAVCFAHLAIRDIDTLLEDCARYRNALAVAEINYAGELEQRDERIEHWRAAHANAMAQIERLTTELDRARQDCKAIEQHCNEQIREAERRIAESQHADQRTIADLMAERDAARDRVRALEAKCALHAASEAQLDARVEGTSLQLANNSSGAAHRRVHELEAALRYIADSSQELMDADHAICVARAGAALAAADGQQPKAEQTKVDCDKCGGAGWLRGRELGVHPRIRTRTQ